MNSFPPLLLPLPGVIPPFCGVFRCWHSDSDGYFPGHHFLPSCCFGWCPRGSNIRHPGSLHLPFHFAHPCHRATVCLLVQLHGLPVGRDIPPVRHHGVSFWGERTDGFREGEAKRITRLPSVTEWTAAERNTAHNSRLDLFTAAPRVEP